MNTSHPLLALIALFFAFTAHSAYMISSAEAAELYHNGQILSMEGPEPEYSEALVAESGKIIFIGDIIKAKKQYPDARKVDLAGHTMLPGFIDAHSHIGMVSDTMGQVDLSSPPVGDTNNFDDIVEKLIAYKRDSKIVDGEWIFAWGYDENQLEEKQHISKKELDKAFPSNPVYLQHTSGHMGVANSAALKIGGISADSIDPEGGVIVRYPGSDEPTGLVQEVAMYFFAGTAIQEFKGKKASLFDRAQDYYAENGVTTAQEGLSDPDTMAFLTNKAEKGELKIDVTVLAGVSEIEESKYNFGKLENGLKFQGIKIISDGSPQGKTAFFSKPYQVPVEGCESDCRGFPNINQTDLNQIFLKGYQSNRQLFIHSNGDASIDTIINAHEFASKELDQALDTDRRTVIIHSQFVRPDQLDTFKKYRMMPSFFTNHAFFWGDVHVENLGEERAFFLSPMRAAAERGLIYTNHTDATVTPISQLFAVWTAVNRVSRSGTVIGEAQRVSPYAALKAVTINAAVQLFEEEDKGSLEVGKFADFVVLNENPLTADLMKIKDIQVVQTIKEGNIVYQNTAFKSQ